MVCGVVVNIFMNNTVYVVMMTTDILMSANQLYYSLVKSNYTLYIYLATMCSSYFVH